jgi:lipoprotein-anchoring transpeptidase ErfK/SrfK
MYRIHGTNAPSSIGTAASSGCIRMLNKEVVELFDATPVGTKVIVQ